MSFVVSSAGGVPVGAETVGTSPALAETVGSDPAEAGVSDELIELTPKAAAPIKARTRIAATILRGFFMGATLSFTFPPATLDSRSKPGVALQDEKTLGG